MISENHKQIFRDFCQFLDKNNVVYFLVAGSLLGAIRDKRPIDSDSDFDIGVYAEDFEKVRQLILNSEIYHIYNAWRRELTVLKRTFTKSESQIDIFAIERTKTNSYLYQNKMNSFSGIWDIEWRLSFPRYCFDELINYTNFLPNLTIKIPKYYNDVLSLEYGNWKIPEEHWSNIDAPAFDRNYRQIGIIIPTFLRDDCVKKLINSIENTYPQDWYRLYIGDQGFYTEEKKEYYNSLEKKGHYITYLPFNSGLSYIRNYLISKAKEPHIFIADDDFLITQKTKIQNFVDILNTEYNIGVVGGTLKGHSEYNYDLLFKNNLYYIQLKPKQHSYSQKSLIKSSIPYNYCDIILNFSFFKREVFNDILWDEQLKMVEHTDFYLRLKKLNNWKVTFTSTVEAEHPTKNNSSEYLLFRQNLNNEKYQEIFYKKWGLKESKMIYLKED